MPLCLGQHVALRYGEASATWLGTHRVSAQSGGLRHHFCTCISVTFPVNLQVQHGKQGTDADRRRRRRSAPPGGSPPAAHSTRPRPGDARRPGPPWPVPPRWPAIAGTHSTPAWPAPAAGLETHSGTAQHPVGLRFFKFGGQRGRTRVPPPHRGVTGVRRGEQLAGGAHASWNAEHLTCTRTHAHTPFPPLFCKPLQHTHPMVPCSVGKSPDPPEARGAGGIGPALLAGTDCSPPAWPTSERVPG